MSFIHVIIVIVVLFIAWVVGSEVYRYFNYGVGPLTGDPQMKPDEYDWWTGEPIWHSQESYDRQVERVSRGEGWTQEVYSWPEINAMYTDMEAYYAQLDSIPTYPGDPLNGLRQAAAENARLIAEERRYAPNISATVFSAIIFAVVVGAVLLGVYLVDKSGIASTSDWVRGDFELSSNTVLIGVFGFIIWGVLLGAVASGFSTNGFVVMVLSSIVLGGLFMVFSDSSMGAEGSFIRSISALVALACAGMSLSCAIASIICFVRGI